MPKKNEAPLVLSQLKTRTLFKVVQEERVKMTRKIQGKDYVVLTVDDVYRVHNAKADSGRNVEIQNVRDMRFKDGEIRTSGWIASIPAETAKAIRVYQP